MAKTFLQLNDQIVTWRTKHNDIVNNIGDLAQLTPIIGDSFDSDLVTAIIRAASTGTDSAQVVAIMSSNFADSSIGSIQLKQEQNLILYDSDGTVLKSLWGAGI